MSYLCNMSKLLNHVFDVSLLDNLTKLGIYKITHLSKIDVSYIGSASGTFNGKKCQKGFYRRFLEHLRALENEKHDSKYLQNVVNKYGIDGLRFEIYSCFPMPYGDFQYSITAIIKAIFPPNGSHGKK